MSDIRFHPDSAYQLSVRLNGLDIGLIIRSVSRNLWYLSLNKNHLLKRFDNEKIDSKLNELNGVSDA